MENSRFSLTLPELFRVLNGEQARTRLEQKAIDDAEWEKLIHEAMNGSLLKEASEKVVAWTEGLCDESSPGARTLRKVFANSRLEAAYCLKKALKALLMVTEGSHSASIRLPILSAKVTETLMR
nr:TIGR02679 domain-containing protein [Paenibacillus sp. yr247]